MPIDLTLLDPEPLPAAALAAYFYFSAATFGYLLRSARPDSGFRAAKILAASIAWPVYWTVAHGIATSVHELVSGVVGTARAISGLLVGAIDIATSILWSTIHIVVGLLSNVTQALADYFAQHETKLYNAYAKFGIPLMLGYQVSRRLGACDGFLACTSELGKAVLWALFWPVWFID
jgi:hypothetical protein